MSKELKKPIHPCKKDCANRCVGCAINCEKWSNYVVDRDKYYKERMEHTEANSYTSKEIYRLYPND